MKNILLIGTALFLSYKLGEKKAQMAAMDYYITRQFAAAGGVFIDEYVTMTPGGVSFTQDANLATPLFFFDALTLKNLIRKFSPGSVLKLETANNLIQQV